MRGKPVKGQGMGRWTDQGHSCENALVGAGYIPGPQQWAQQLVWQGYRPFLLLLFLKRQLKCMESFPKGHLQGLLWCLVHVCVSVRVFTCRSQAIRKGFFVLIVWACLPGCILDCCCSVLFSRNKQIKWRSPIWKKILLQVAFYSSVSLMLQACRSGPQVTIIHDYVFSCLLWVFMFWYKSELSSVGFPKPCLFVLFVCSSEAVHQVWN